jgi:hypothetical protein
MADDRVRGTGLHGDQPRRLGLSDGSRLLLDCDSADGPHVTWRRVGRRGWKRLSVPQARALAGDRYEEYVTRRTRAEAEWMRAVADWYVEEADRLEGQLEEAITR